MVNRKQQANMETSAEVPGFIRRPEQPGGRAGRPNNSIMTPTQMTSSPLPRDVAGVLSPESTAALTDAFRLHLAQPSAPADQRITEALGRICAEARRDQIPPERLLVAFKGVWNSLPEVRQLHGQRATEEVRDLVTLCIERYYAAE